MMNMAVRFRTTPPPISDDRARELCDFPGHAVTSDGRVLTCRIGGKWQPRYTPEWREMPQYKRPVYLSVTLWRNNKPHHVYVHKLVLTTFVGDRPEHHEACHLDGSKTNNSVENLAWALHSENESHKRLHGTPPVGTRNGTARLNDELVKQIRSSTGTQKEIAAKFGIAQPTVCNVRKRKTWAHVR
jgi:hypothetical protein